MTYRRRHYDRSFRKPQRAIRIVTALILAIGAGVVIWALSRPDARRERAIRGFQLGDTAAVVLGELGEPRRCPIGTLEHLVGSFPSGWSAAAQSAAVERLRRETDERWVYPLRPEPNPCGEPRAVTEVGLGRDGRVLWILPLSGRHPLVLPEAYAPGTMLNDTL